LVSEDLVAAEVAVVISVKLSDFAAVVMLLVSEGVTSH
jgi:hypothetical protein